MEAKDKTRITGTEMKFMRITAGTLEWTVEHRKSY
jgi:hypothetical protein